MAGRLTTFKQGLDTSLHKQTLPNLRDRRQSFPDPNTRVGICGQIDLGQGGAQADLTSKIFVCGAVLGIVCEGAAKQVAQQVYEQGKGKGFPRV